MLPSLSPDTPAPLTAEHEQTLRELIARTTDIGAVTASPGILTTLLAEIDRLRKDNDWLHRHYASQIDQSVQLRDELDEAQNQFNELSREMSAVTRERAEAGESR